VTAVDRTVHLYSKLWMAYIGAALMAVLGAGAAQAGGDPATLITGLRADDYYYSRPASVVTESGIEMLYVSSDGRLMYQAAGSEPQRLDEDAKEPGGRYLSLIREGDHRYVLWWKKTDPGPKFLHFKASADGGKTFGPVRVINSATGVLAHYRLASNGKGELGVVYHDEREGAYQIYFNRSIDHGKSWLEQDVRLDMLPSGRPAAAPAEPAKETGAQGPQRVPAAAASQYNAAEPELVRVGDTLVAVWKERRLDEAGKPIMVTTSRRSADGGKTWDDPVDIDRALQQLVDATLSVAAGKVVLIGNLGGTGVVAYRSPDQGKTWEKLGAVPGSERANNSQLHTAVQDERVNLIYTTKEGEGKPAVRYTALDANTGKWGDPADIEKDAHGMTQALNPDIAALEDGALVGVWEDYRNIQPNVYLNYSVDGGKTWQADAVGLEPPGRYASIVPEVDVQDGRVVVFFQRFPEAQRDKLDYLAQELTYEPGKGLAGVPQHSEVSVADKEQKLKERVEALWKLRIEKKFDDTYGFFDPAYRAKVKKESFPMIQGNIVYKGYEIEKMEIKGNVANVVVKTNIEVPETQIMGQKVKLPPRDTKVPTDWVWIHDNWYIVYQGPLRKPLLQY
jgi:BNR repeat-like domain